VARAVKLPGLTRRRQAYEVRVRVPKDVADSYGTKTHIVRSLRTRDLAEASQRYAGVRAEILAGFEQARANLAPALKQAGSGTRRGVVEQYRRRRYDDLRLERAEIVAKCLSNLPAFYRGDFVPTPDDRINGASYWDDIIGAGSYTDDTLRTFRDENGKTRIEYRKGKLQPYPDEDAVLYALGWNMEKRLAELRRKAELADGREFLREVPEHLSDRERRLTALDILQAEIELLEGAKPPMPIEASVPVRAQTPDLAAVAPSTVPLMSEVFVRFRSEHADIAARVAMIESCVHDLRELFDDKPINAYTVADARTYKDMLRSLPPNWRKPREFRDLSIRDAYTKAKSLDLAKPKPATVSNKLGGLRQLFNWLAAEYSDYNVKNPFADVRVPKSDIAANEARNPFSSNQLKAIFDAPLFTGALSVRDWQSPGTVDLQGHPLRWLVVLGLYTGARLGELCQLKKSNVKLFDNIYYLSFDPSMKLKTKRGVKTSPGVRNIPVHVDVIGAGFLEYVQGLKDERLFDYPDRGGRHSDAAGKAFNRMIATLGLKEANEQQRAKVDFHSFRHNFTDACRRARVDSEIRERLIGHALEGMSARYGSDYRGQLVDMEMLRHAYDEMQKIRYPDVKLQRL
jgi:integrase